MTKLLTRSENIRTFILEHVEKHPSDINTFTANHFKITRQAVNRHLLRLVHEGSLSVSGRTKDRVYKLSAITNWVEKYDIDENLAEDVVWRDDVSKILGEMPDNVKDIWHYGFTEMFNNAIDHSEGKNIIVAIKTTAATAEMMIVDDGVGIFKKIQKAINLMDERHAVLELAKGKLTTDPENHTGEGIFFTSRMFDKFDIISGGVYFSHSFDEEEDWILEQGEISSRTAVWMKLSNHTARTTKKIFAKFTSGDDLVFNKTVVPVKLAQYGDENLISRSQAKRLLARVDRFKIVMFNFEGVKNIGQAFADEIFRVFQQRHPEIELIPYNTNSEIKRMIARSKG